MRKIQLILKTLNNIEEIIKDANSYKKSVVDFASDFSMGFIDFIIEKYLAKRLDMMKIII